MATGFLRFVFGLGFVPLGMKSANRANARVLFFHASKLRG